MRAVAIAGGLLVVMTLAVGCGEPTVAPTESTIFTPRFSAHTGSTVEAVVATIPVGAKPVGVAVNTTTNRVYVSHDKGMGHVSVIDGATNAVIATIPVGSLLRAVAVNTTTASTCPASTAAPSSSWTGPRTRSSPLSPCACLLALR